MLAPSSKGPRRFHVVVADPLQVTIHERVPELEQHLIAIIFVSLALFIRDGLFDNFLFVQVSSNGFKVALGKVFDDVILAQNGSKVGKKVFDEDLGRLCVS
jgi:hypothetical protein